MGLSSSTLGVGIDDTVKTMKICCSGEEVEESEWFDRPDHPLLNNLILSKLFKHLSRNEFTECRLVCKAWNMSTIPFTRKEFQVTLYRSDSEDSRKHRTIENFVECFSSNQLGIPFGRYTLGSFCTTDGVGQKFLQMYGPTISSLQFVDGDHIAVEDVSEILRSTPKLETFRIPNRLQSRDGNIVKLFPEDPNTRLVSLKRLIVKSDFPEERDKFCPTFLEELITAAENISCLELHDSRAYSRREFMIPSQFESTVKYYERSSSLQVLGLIEKLGRESSIQELTISHMEREESELIDFLLKISRKPSGLKLRSFHYYRYNTSKYTDKLIPLVSCFNDTLENLYLLDPPHSSFMELKKMHRLKRLSMYWPMGFNATLVNFSKVFPVLEELELDYLACGLDQGYNEFFQVSEPCLNMKSLKVTNHIYKINGFSQIVRNFPNLTKLQMTIELEDVETLRQIWSHLTQLKYLSINCAIETNDTLDSVITGISTLAIQEVRGGLRNINKIKTVVERMDMISKLRDQYCGFPSIANLTDLRSLNLDLRGEDGGSKKYMTDLTMFFGFYTMKHLRCLQLRHCKLTKTCCEILIKDLGLESWRFWLPELDLVISSNGN